MHHTASQVGPYYNQHRKLSRRDAKINMWPIRAIYSQVDYYSMVYSKNWCAYFETTLSLNYIRSNKEVTYKEQRLFRELRKL